MYYASNIDAALDLDDITSSIADRAEQAVDEVTQAAKREGERIVSSVVGTTPAAPAPQRITQRIGSLARRPAPTFVPAPLPAVSSQLQPLGAAPFRGPSLQVAPTFAVAEAPSMARPVMFAQAAPPQAGGGMGTPLLIGAAVLAGLFLFSKGK